MNFPEHLKYTSEHEWIRVESDFGYVGITEFAAGELGDIVFVDLPTLGKKVEKGKSFGTIEAVKAVSDLYSPVTGEIVEINNNIKDHPEIVNKEPYGEGWMVKIKISEMSELNDLLDVNAYKKIAAK